MLGAGTGYLTSVLANSGAVVPTGPYGGLVASTNQPATKAVTASVVLGTS